MARGIIYVMTTVVPGLIKIGKTKSENFEQRMYNLEHNGYFNVVGLKRRFAIEVDSYDEKESLLDDIFSKSRVPGSELFALDAGIVVQLLSSFDGKQIYPETETKQEAFVEAAEERRENQDRDKVPEGIYKINHNIKGYGKITATMQVKDGQFIVLHGSKCSPIEKDPKRKPEIVKTAIIKNGILQNDISCPSPSTAGWVVLNSPNNGWNEWKNSDGKPIAIYRSEKT